MRTLLLDRTTWDLVLDVYGNIAVADDPYSQAQDAASAIKLYQGELWYDVTQGIPYYEQVLGYAPPFSLFKALMNAAALTVPGVAQATTFINSFEGRAIAGQAQLVNDAGDKSVANF